MKEGKGMATEISQQELFRILQEKQKGKEPVIAAVDGRACSGKTTLSLFLQEKLSCPVFHMDDYYLPFAEREESWREHPGANMNFRRLEQEVLGPFSEGKRGSSRPYSCHENIFGEAVPFEAGGLLLIEGSYSHHPLLRKYYDLKIFLTCTPALQKSRILQREKERAEMFRKLWVSLEERYFENFHVAENADYIIHSAGKKE